MGRCLEGGDVLESAAYDGVQNNLIGEERRESGEEERRERSIESNSKKQESQRFMVEG